MSNNPTPKKVINKDMRFFIIDSIFIFISNLHKAYQNEKLIYY